VIELEMGASYHLIGRSGLRAMGALLLTVPGSQDFPQCLDFVGCFKNKHSGEDKMSLRELSGKTVFELDRQTFIGLYCDYCRFTEFCAKYDRAVQNCKCFVNEGIFDRFFRKKGM
jgi:predicted nucleic-acid-binding Zn-ribbon protein